MNFADIPTMEHNSQVKQRHYLKHKSKVLEVKKRKKERKKEGGTKTQIYKKRKRRKSIEKRNKRRN